MAATVVRFQPKRERITREAAASLADALREFPEEQVPASARAALLNALHKLTHPDTQESIWPGGFSMLSRTQTAAVWDAIRRLRPEERPNQVRHAFDLVLLNLRQDTGEVMLTRDQLAAEIGCAARHVSTIMGTLERLGVIRRERRRIEGVQGRGMAVYFINPHVAWNGSLEVRKEEAAETPPPLLRLMQGGAEESR
jgi:CRP-like cAMP-binding protein